MEGTYLYARETLNHVDDAFCVQQCPCSLFTYQAYSAYLRGNLVHHRVQVHLLYQLKLAVDGFLH